MERSPAARRRRRRSLGSAALAAWLAASLAPVGCKSYVGTTAASYLKRVQDDPDPNVRYLAYDKLASPACYDTPGQKTEAVRTLVGKLKKGAEPVATRAVICHTLGELRDPEARDAVLKAVNDNDGVVRVEACRALGKVGRAEDVTVLARVMTVDTLEDCRIAAVEAIGELNANDPRITRMLVDGMTHDDPALRLASLTALKKLTGRDVGVNPVAWAKLMNDGASAAPGTGPALAERGPATRPNDRDATFGRSTRDSQTRAASYPPTPPASNVLE